MQIDLQSRLPIYEQLKLQISSRILSGDLEANASLPSVRSFARDLGVNPNTVQKAYQDLERDGLIYSVAGSGSFVSNDPKLREKLLSDHEMLLESSISNAKGAGIKKARAQSVLDKVYKEEGSINDRSKKPD